MGPDDAMHQRETETQPAVAAGRRRVALGEVLEDRVEAIGGDAEAVVGHRDANPRPVVVG